MIELKISSHFKLFYRTESLDYQSVVGLEDFLDGKRLDSIFLNNETRFSIQDGLGSPGDSVAEGPGPYAVSHFVN
jgi:hypothetical protein